MKLRADYLGIHDKKYKKLIAGGETSWSSAGDVAGRVQFYSECLNLRENPGPSVLVLGCGDGETSLALAVLGCSVSGVDISPTAIRWASKRAMREGFQSRFTCPILIAVCGFSCLESRISRDEDEWDMLEAVFTKASVDGMDD